MQKAFFGCALALPHLTNATGLATSDEDDLASLAMAQDDQASATENVFLGQTEAEQAQFWDAYLSQVHAYVEAEAADTPYWTDGYTSLSQADVDALANADSSVKQWGKKSGLAQTQAGIDSDTEPPRPVLKSVLQGVSRGAKKTASWAGKSATKTAQAAGTAATNKAVNSYHKFSAPMRAMGVSMPSDDKMRVFLDVNTKVARMAKRIHAKGYDVKRMVENFKQKHLGEIEFVANLLKDAYDIAGDAGRSIPVVDLILKISEFKGNVTAIFDALDAVDDGNSSCWIKSEFRTFKFGKPKTCEEQKMDTGMGGICYAKCTQGPAGKGHGTGPLCWGQCNPAIHSTCGPLCLLLTESPTACKDFVVGVTKDVISTGVHAAGQEYVGAILGGLSVAAQLAYPVCKNFNYPLNN